MHTFPASWLTTLLILSPIWSPLCARGAEANTHAFDSSQTSLSLRSQMGIPFTPSSARPALNRHTGTIHSGPRKPNERTPARYTTSPPRTSHPRPLASRFDGTGRLGPGPFIGPRREYSLFPTQSTDLAGPSSLASAFPLFPDIRPTFVMGSIPQQRENEHDRMNETSHEILHGGN